jgi:hypothetical protein
MWLRPEFPATDIGASSVPVRFKFFFWGGFQRDVWVLQTSNPYITH